MTAEKKAAWRAAPQKPELNRYYQSLYGLSIPNSKNFLRPRKVPQKPANRTNQQ